MIAWEMIFLQTHKSLSLFQGIAKQAETTPVEVSQWRFLGSVAEVFAQTKQVQFHMKSRAHLAFCLE